MAGVIGHDEAHIKDKTLSESKIKIKDKNFYSIRRQINIIYNIIF